MWLATTGNRRQPAPQRGAVVEGETRGTHTASHQ